MTGLKYQEARRAAERAARTSYGKLIAVLAASTRDVAAAEDALSEAFQAALRAWPERGVPEKPEAWLLVTARNTLRHTRRHERVKSAAVVTLETINLATAEESDQWIFPDQRLALLFVCTHPAIDPAVQAPLMLQTVFGLKASHIAASFLVSPAAMSQRLVRAKAKIRDAGIGFEIPDSVALPERLSAVLSAIYAAFGTGWEDVLGEDPKRKGLAKETIWLARTIVALLPDNPEAKGLLALMLYCEARRDARRGPNGAFIPIDRQDPNLWSRAMIGEAEKLLADAARKAVLGRFQLEAAIQSVHVQRAVTGVLNWPALISLYGLLVDHAPTTGNRVARAAVIAEAGEPEPALRLLDDLEEEATDYQPLWATRGRVLTLLRKTEEARKAYETAAGLSEDLALREFLLTAVQPH